MVRIISQFRLEVEEVKILDSWSVHGQAFRRRRHAA